MSISTDSMTAEPVLLRHDEDGIATLTLNRPAKYNALSEELLISLQNELDQLKDRFTDYRDQVTQHFMRTSELVQEMTQSYRAVYEHLAIGAQNLCGGQIEAPHRNNDTPEALDTGDSVEALTGSDPDYDDLAGDMPRISDLDIKADASSRHPLKH